MTNAAIQSAMSNNLTAVTDATKQVTTIEAVSETAKQAASTFESVRKVIEELVIERQVWEDTLVRSANEYKYAVMQKCYRLYKCMEGNSSEAKALRKALDDYIKSKGYQARPSSHTMNKIVRCVFAGHDEKVAKHRVSTYAIALRVALNAGVTVEDLPQYLTNEGGVEVLRAKAAGRATDVVTPKQKAVLGSLSVKNEELGSFKHSAIVEKYDAGKTDQNVVLLGSWQVDGSITVRAIVEGKGVVNAALASFHSTKKANDAKKVAEQEQQTLAAATASAIKDAATEALFSQLVSA